MGPNESDDICGTLYFETEDGEYKEMGNIKADIEAMLDDMELDVKNYFDSKTGEWTATIKLKKKDQLRLQFYILRKLVKYWFLGRLLLIKTKRRLNKYGQTNI